MFNSIKINKSLIFILILWVITGVYLKPASYVVIIFTFINWLRGRNYTDIIIGFFTLLIYSDSYYLVFAKDIKPYVALLIGLYALYYKKHLDVSKIYLPFVPFFLYAVFLLSFSETLSLSFQKTVSYCILYFFVPTYLYHAYKQDKIEIFKKLLLITNLILIAGFVFYFINEEVTLSHEGRYRGIFGNPNGIGLYCVFIYIMMSVVRDKFPDYITEKENILFNLLIFITIFWSGSRTSMVAIFLFIGIQKLNRTSTLLSFLSFLLLVILYQYIDEIFMEFVHYFQYESYFRIDSIKDGSGRSIAWEFAWEHIQKNFLFGKGFDYNQYLFLAPENRLTLKALNHEGDVHNIYLGFWLDVGLIGLIIYFTAFINIFIKASRLSKLALPCLLSFLFMGNYEPWLIASLNPYTIQMLMTLTIIFYCRPEDEVSSNDKMPSTT